MPHRDFFNLPKGFSEADLGMAGKELMDRFWQRDPAAREKIQSGLAEHLPEILDIAGTRVRLNQALAMVAAMVTANK